MANQRKRTARIFSLLLAILTLLAFAACAGGGTGGGKETAGSGTEGAEQTSPWADSLPSDLNYNGRDFRFLYPDYYEDEIFCEDTASPDIVSEAVYRTQMMVEERLGIKYAPEFSTLLREPLNTYIQTTCMTGDVWDSVTNLATMLQMLAGTGTLTDLTKLQYFDFEKPYWLQSFVQENKVDGHMYVAGGDASVTYLECIIALAYNQNLADDLSLGDIQQLAHDGGWTAEKMKEYTLACFSSPDPSNPDYANDTYGFAVVNDNHITAMATGLGATVFSKGENGDLSFTYANNRGIDVVQFLVHFLNDNRECYGNYGSGNVVEKATAARDSFASGRVLMATIQLDDFTSVYQNVAFDLKLLPLPKWSEDEEYRTFSRGTFLLYGVPRACADPDFASAVLECLASVSYSQLSPAYFEDALKIKYTDASPLTRDIFDIIRQSVYFDYGIYNCMELETDSLVKKAVNANDENWKSFCKAKERVVLRKLQNYFDKITEYEEDAA